MPYITSTAECQVSRSELISCVLHSPEMISEKTQRRSVLAWESGRPGPWGYSLPLRRLVASACVNAVKPPLPMVNHGLLGSQAGIPAQRSDAPVERDAPATNPEFR